MSEIDLTSPEIKQAIADAVAAEVSGLKAKNAELIEANKKLRKGQEVDPADFERIEQERDELRGKLSEANRALTKANKTAEEATKRATDIEGAYHGSLRDAALTDELTKAGVTNPVHLKAAKALLSSQVAVAIDGDARVVKAGDKGVGDFIKEWAGSDEGKHFTAPTNSNGGGAQGSPARNPNAPSVTRQAFEAMDHVARAEHMKNQGVVTDA